MRLGLGVDRWPRSTAYAAVGALVGAGAPLTVFAYRAATRRKARRQRYGVMSLAGATVTAAVGRILGRQRDSQLGYRRCMERMRDEYEAVVAHDFRDPIAGIVAQTALLLRKADREEVTVPVSALRRVEQLGWRLDRLVADQLDASRIERGRMVLEVRPVLLQEAVPALVRKLGSTLGAHHVAIDCRGAPRPVLADQARVDQVLTNLLENAAKFSPPESPLEVEIEQTPEGAAVTVVDHGEGIGAADMPRLFDRNYQVRRTREHKSGLGMGLYLSKGIVEALGGRLEVQSQPGVGSRFRVVLPGAEPSPKASETPAHAGVPRPEVARDGYNAVVTIKGKSFARVLAALKSLGRVGTTGFYNVLMLGVSEPDHLLENVEDRASSDSRLSAVSTVVPIERLFTFRTPEEFEAQAKTAVEEYLPRLAGKSFHVRVHRRGMKGRVASHAVERSLGEYLIDRLAAAGTPGRISFRDPDAIVDVETVRTRGGASLWTREQLEQHPLLGLD